MQDDHPFKDISVRHESSLGLLHHRMRNLCEPISPDLGEDFKTNIEKADRPELLNSHSLCFLRKKGDRSKIELKKMKLSSKQIIEQRQQIPLNNMSTFFYRIQLEIHPSRKNPVI